MKCLALYQKIIELSFRIVLEICVLLAFIQMSVYYNNSS